jgi:chitodextrinase
VCRFTPGSPGDTVTHSDTGLTAATSYHYALKVRDSSGKLGQMSNVATATTRATTPGRVTDLAATARSARAIELTFSAAGSDGTTPPPVATYIVKQARTPITNAAEFDDAKSLCGGVCRFTPGAVGDKLTLEVTELSPGTTYHYALRAQDAAGNLGAISNAASATTQAAPGTEVTTIAYPAGYSLISLPGGTRVPADGVLFAWFNQGSGGRYKSLPAPTPLASGRAYWAYFASPVEVEVGVGRGKASSKLGAFKASMVGNPSGTKRATVSGFDFGAVWDQSLNSGAGGYRMTGYRKPARLEPGEGMWVFSYRKTTVKVRAR